MVWGEVQGEGDVFRFDSRQAYRSTCASYIAGPLPAGDFIDPAAVGEALPDLSVFLTPVEYVSVPLDATYLAAFAAVPKVWRDVLDVK